MVTMHAAKLIVKLAVKEAGKNLSPHLKSVATLPCEIDRLVGCF